MYVAYVSSNECYSVLFCFFFQAEDGIRDLVRSRGLGDVYKRQIQNNTKLALALTVFLNTDFTDYTDENGFFFSIQPVSYTHLTLPTSDLV